MKTSELTRKIEDFVAGLGPAVIENIDIDQNGGGQYVRLKFMVGMDAKP